MLIYDALKQDHETLKLLLAELVKSEAGSDACKDFIAIIKAELVPHARAEEAVFYNGLRAIPDLELKDLILRHGYGEHAEAEAILHTLIGAEGLSMKGDALAKKLKEELEHHIEEEEGEMFSAARQLLTDDEAEMMGEAFLRLKAEIAEQGDMRNMMEFLVNLMPERLRPKTHQI